MLGKLLQDCFKFFFVDFTIQWWWYFCETGEKRVESFKFQFLPLSGILQEEIGKCKKSNMCEGVCKLDILFKPSVTQFWRIRSTCVTKTDALSEHIRCFP